MAEQDFLASYGVSIDEEGITRLHGILSENREKASGVADAFSDAEAALRSWLNALSGEIPETDFSLPAFTPELDLSRVSVQLAAFMSAASTRFKLSADTAAMLAAAQSALEDIRDLFAGTKLTLKVTYEAEDPPGGGGEDDGKDGEKPGRPGVPEIPELNGLESNGRVEIPELPEWPKIEEPPRWPEIPDVPEWPEILKPPEWPEMENAPVWPEIPKPPDWPEIKAPEWPELKASVFPESEENPRSNEAPVIPEASEYPETKIIPDRSEISASLIFPAAEFQTLPDLSEALKTNFQLSSGMSKSDDLKKLPEWSEIQKPPTWPELSKAPEWPKMPDLVPEIILPEMPLPEQHSSAAETRIEAPVTIQVTAEGSDPVALGESIYNIAQRYQLRTLRSS